MKKLYFTVLKLIMLVIATSSFSFSGLAQEHSVAHQWNEVLLDCIRNDFARPTVHARNLWHSSVLMYDSWAAYSDDAQPFFLARTVGNFHCEYEGVPIPADVEAAQVEAMSYAMCRFIKHRFQNSPGWNNIVVLVDDKMAELGFDVENTSIDYIGGTPAEFGNYIAEQMIQFGLADGSNEINSYGNQYYGPVNEPIFPELPGNPWMTEPNRWQPISVSFFIDQGGNPLPTGMPDFLSPEWGNVVPFALHDSVLTTYVRDGDVYKVYHDPGAPPVIDTLQQEGMENLWKWGHSLVSSWQGHHDPNDGVMWDISPASMGNIPFESLPTTTEEYQQFYDWEEGGDPGTGYALNPATGQPYEPQMVPRGDYARVLAEFWADGPHSETPPGHWFTIVNYVNEHPMLEKRWNGQGEILDDLEWDVKTYFVLGGALHDVAVSCWGIKGWYDTARPVSAIRFMAEKGQSTDPDLPNYHPGGFPLAPGKVELVMEGDPLAGDNNEHLYKIKLLTWQGPDFIDDPQTDIAGVDWILAENWWPYQRPTFVSPPFAGYISGHSTFSRAAAEVLTLITGDEYFPGGMGVFDAEQNEYLVFEEGPTQTIELQWAKYADASDQCSLSRIWGGIHPPFDDIPGRKIGKQIGPNAYNYAQSFLYADLPKITAIVASDYQLNDADAGNTITITATYDRDMDPEYSPVIAFPHDDALLASLVLETSMWIASDTYEATFLLNDANESLLESWIQVSGGIDLQGKSALPALSAQPIMIDTENPTVALAMPEMAIVNDAVAASGSFEVSLNFSEDLDDSVVPVLGFSGADPLANTLSWNEAMSYWADNATYVAVFDVADANEELSGIDLNVSGAKDLLGNDQELSFDLAEAFEIDTRNPIALSVDLSSVILADAQVGSEALTVSINFDEVMDINEVPSIAFPNEDPMLNSLVFNEAASMWLDDMNYSAVFDLMDADEEMMSIDLASVSAKDMAGNNQVENTISNALIIDTRNPLVTALSSSAPIIADANVGPEGFEITLEFDEAMDITMIPDLSFTGDDPEQNTLTLNEGASSWLNNTTFVAVYDVADDGEELDMINVHAMAARDAVGNEQSMYDAMNNFTVDTRNPEVVLLSANTYVIDEGDAGSATFELVAIFDEPMDESGTPSFTFPLENPNTIITPNPSESFWVNSVTYTGAFDVAALDASIQNIDVGFSAFTDQAGNEQAMAYYADFFDILITIIGVEELAGSFDGILVYPNPAPSGADVIVKLPAATSPQLRYEVYGLDGSLIAAEEAPAMEQQNLRLQTAGLAAGMYFIHLHDGSDRAVLKLQVMK